MKAEIITIGDEILIGQIVDTNSAWIAARLNEAGFTVVRKLTVGDDRREIADAVEGAMRTADAVIVTGGLGPTKDDITKQTLAGIFGGEWYATGKLTNATAGYSPHAASSTTS
mgnify:CR=1 FL=1